MSFGDFVQEKLQTLAGSVDSSGKILPGKKETVDYAVNYIKNEASVDISTETQVDPETGEEYEAIVVDNQVCASPTDISDKVNQAGALNTVDNYFDGTEIYMGVLSTTGGEKFAKAIAFSNGAKLAFHKVEGDAHTFDISNAGIIIRVMEAIPNVRPASVTLRSSNGLLLPGVLFGSVFNTDNDMSYIKYYICKGDSGDGYVKGFCSSDDTEPTEEDFDNCNMNLFTGYEYDDAEQKYVPTMRSGEYGYMHGGFAIVGMERKVDESYDNDEYGAVVWRDNGTPFHVIMRNSSPNEANCGVNWRRIFTNSPDKIACLAPIFTPSSNYYASKYSFWSMVIAEDGLYDLTVGDMGSFRYDHGFALNMY